MFATANGHVGKGASVADNFRILFDEFTGKNKDPKKLKELLEEALENGALRFIYNCTRTRTTNT